MHHQPLRAARGAVRPFAKPLSALALGLALAGVLGGAVAQPAPAAAVPAAPPADPRLVWDLTPLFANDDAWEAERRAVAAEIPSLRALRGTLGRDAVALADALDRVSGVQRRLQRLWVYASTQLSTANANRRNQERSALMAQLGGQLRSATAWLEPEIQALGAEKVAAFRAAQPQRLARHATTLRQTLRQAPHTLSPEVEAALAAYQPVLNSFSNTRELLVNADIRWPTITVDGKPVVVNDTGYTELRRHPDREVRRRAFEAFFGTYAQHENTLGALLAQRVNQGVIGARLRGHPTAATASLFATEVPEPILRTLVAEVNTGLPTLHRYFKLRQRLLKLPDLHYHDVYPNLVDSPRRFDPATSAALTLASVKPLGDEYQRLLGEALKAGTMHVRPQPGKRGGAYATSVYGLTPYIFLNHDDSFESLVTYAHEWGHGMHSILAQRAQPPESAGYPLFLAEIASTTNEVLLTDHLLKTATTREERIAVLAQVLERLRAAFFRQTMFAEFELQVHDAQQRGEPLSGARLSEIYCGLLRKYHGADAGLMKLDPAVCREWAFVPHFHRPFYVYAYATSATAAQFFGERLIAGTPGVRDAYLDVLRAGSSVPPHESLLRAGLDLTQPAPYRALIQRMDAVLDEMERLIAEPRG